jgi:orotidine 5'-phosphate decarboxylase subfamily 2
MVTDSVQEAQPGGFAERLRQRSRAIKSWLCIGLDPDPVKFPPNVPRTASGMLQFCREIIQSTQQFAVCYKINSAFFEAFGSPGWKALEDVRAEVPPKIPVILDSKRGDIGNTAAAYAKALFDSLRADAVTVNPFLGWDSLQPFLDYSGCGVLIVCRTSNPGSRDFQELEIQGEPLYMRIAREALLQRVPADVGLVVGATHPEALERVRRLDEEIIILAPGVGAQGASVAQAVRAGSNSNGDNLLASASRDILYPSSRGAPADEARRVAELWAGESWRVKEHDGAPA